MVVEDADAPLPNIPGARRDLGESDFIPADGGEKGNGKNILEGGFRYGGCWSGKVWSGPKPVLGDGAHRYFFQVIGLKEDLPSLHGQRDQNSKPRR